MRCISNGFQRNKIKGFTHFSSFPKCKSFNNKFNITFKREFFGKYKNYTKETPLLPPSTQNFTIKKQLRKHNVEVATKPKDSQVDCEKITKVGVYSNLGLFFGKLVVGIYANSSAMIADAIHSFSDLGSDFATFWAVRHSHKPKNEEFPYGYGKYEAIGTLTVGGLLFTTSVGIMWHSINNLTSNQMEIPQEFINGSFNPISPMALALYAAGISIVVKEILFHLTLKEGNKYDNKVIIANAWHHRSDAFSSLIALAGIGSSMYIGNNIMDSIAGIAVGAMITKLSIDVCKGAISELADKQIDGPIFSSVYDCITKVEGVKGFFRLRGRKMGPYIAMDVHIVVDGLITVTSAHQIAERVRHEVMTQHEIIGDFLVHVNPLDADTLSNLENSLNNTPLSYYKRSQSEAEKDVNELVKSNFPEITEITHFNCHYLNNSLSVQVEVRMSPSLKIEEAAVIARKLQEKIMSDVPGVDYADIHLEIL